MRYSAFQFKRFNLYTNQRRINCSGRQGGMEVRQVSAHNGKIKYSH